MYRGDVSVAQTPGTGSNSPRHSSLLGWLLLLAAIVSEVTASLCLKAALDASWLYLLVGIGYAGAFALLAAVLRLGMPLGIAYGIWGACGVALTAVMSHVVFAEPITVAMGVGIGLVMAGVLCVEIGAQAAKRPRLWEDS